MSLYWLKGKISAMKKLEFLRKVKNNRNPMVVDLWAPWCTPCKAMKPTLVQVSQQYAGKVDVLKINIDESPEVMKELGVMSIPTLIGYAKGQEILRRTGIQTQNMLETFFEATYTQTKPALMPPAPATRFIRSILGIGVMILGWSLDRSLVLMILGGVVIFTAFYDRCPIL
jgi:thioredoxin